MNETELDLTKLKKEELLKLIETITNNLNKVKKEARDMYTKQLVLKDLVDSLFDTTGLAGLNETQLVTKFSKAFKLIKYFITQDLI